MCTKIGHKITALAYMRAKIYHKYMVHLLGISTKNQTVKMGQGFYSLCLQCVTLAEVNLKTLLHQQIFNVTPPIASLYPPQHTLAHFWPLK